MEVVLLDVLDARIAVVADGRDRDAALQSKGDPGVAERTPGQGLACCGLGFAAVVAVVLCPVRQPRLNECLHESISPYAV